MDRLGENAGFYAHTRVNACTKPAHSGLYAVYPMYTRMMVEYYSVAHFTIPQFINTGNLQGKLQFLYHFM
jgi:hypothetical protein